MNKIDSISKVLKHISEGTPYKVEFLYDDQYIILVENDEFISDPLAGHDPFFALITTGTI